MQIDESTSRPDSIVQINTLSLEFFLLVPFSWYNFSMMEK